MLCCTNLWGGAAVQMRVVLNAASLMGGVMFSVANVWGMNLWHGQIRLREWPLWTFYLVRWAACGACLAVAPWARVQDGPAQLHGLLGVICFCAHVALPCPRRFSHAECKPALCSSGPSHTHTDC